MPSKYQQAHRKLKTVRYPVPPLSPAYPVVQKLNNIPLPLRKELQDKLGKKLNAYRQVRGDGNCFFRALAFAHISQQKSYFLSKAFPHLMDVCLTVCSKSSIPQDFIPFYDQNLLKGVLKEFWEDEFLHFLKKYKSNYKRSLARMLAKNPYLDWLLILYFRALCVKGLQEQRSRIKGFLDGGESDQIKWYGAESEGMTLQLVSSLVKTGFCIYELRADKVLTYTYGKPAVHLLLSDSHYDLLEENPDCLEEYEDAIQQDDYYSEVQRNFRYGKCLECGKEGQVSDDNMLCPACIDRSIASLGTFKKDSYIRSTCTNCQRSNRKILQQLQLCEECIEDMQKPSIIKQPCQNCGRLTQYALCDECLPPDTQSSYKGKNESHISDIGISSLHNKLQSKISREKRVFEEAARQREKKPQKTSVQKAGIFKGKDEIDCPGCGDSYSAGSFSKSNRCEKCQMKRSPNNPSMVESIKRPTASEIKSSSNKCIICSRTDFFKVTNGVCQKCKNGRSAFRR